MYDQSITSGGIMSVDTPRPTLQELLRTYGPDAVKAAQDAAIEAKAPDHPTFWAEWLADPANTEVHAPTAAPRHPQPPRKTHETCDGCGWPHWVNEMRVIGGRAYREGCEPERVHPLGATIAERASVTAEELRQIRAADLAYSRPEYTKAERDWGERRAKIQLDFNAELREEWPDLPALLTEHGGFGAQAIVQGRGRPEAAMRRRERLDELGPCPLTLLGDRTHTVGVYGPATELTESARAVQAWKAAQGARS